MGCLTLFYFLSRFPVFILFTNLGRIFFFVGKVFWEEEKMAKSKFCFPNCEAVNLIIPGWGSKLSWVYFCKKKKKVFYYFRPISLQKMSFKKNFVAVQTFCFIRSKLSSGISVLSSIRLLSSRFVSVSIRQRQDWATTIIVWLVQFN